MEEERTVLLQVWTLREKIMFGFIVLLLVLFGFFYFFDDVKDQEKKKATLSTYSPVQPKANPRANDNSMIVVDVKGAVKQPGIYQLAAGARVYQAIQAAGGFVKEADQKQINLAAKCKDEMVIYVPTKGEKSISNEGMFTTQADKVNVNTASISELEKLDGIGPSKAEAIVKYRETHGPFQSADELTKVPGIGKKTVEKFQDRITF